MKKLFGLFAALLEIIALILIFDYVRINIRYYVDKNNYNEEFDIQGINNKYTPQGLAYSEKYNVALQTSYNKKGLVSMLYITDVDNNELIKSLKILNSDGSNNTKHVGGITTDDNRIWITSDYTVDIIDLNEVMTTDEDFIKIRESYKLINRGDFTLYDNGILWIGDFFLKYIYDCPDDNPLLFGYILDSDFSYDNPDYVISLPMMIQGMERDKTGKFIFTDSYTNLINSKLTIYSNVLEENASTYTINGRDIPYYKFDESNLIKTYKIPPMAEGFYLKNNDLYILFESGSDTYWEAFPKLYKVLKFSPKEIGKN
ncbi:MAG: hypothetical protein Q4E69_06770 [Bacilli bacterium]|nr:hypothetical protein [Bacilli bacterium]